MSAKSTASTYVALLRGINVGGKHKMPMKDLVEVCTGCKCADVRTYIQSGNVVFTAQASAVKKLAAELEKQLELRFGFAVPVVVRDREQMAHVVRSNPFLKAGKPEKTLHVLRTRRDVACVLVNPLQALHPNANAPSDAPPTSVSAAARFAPYCRSMNGFNSRASICA